MANKENKKNKMGFHMTDNFDGLLNMDSEDFLYGFNEDEANRELAHLDSVAKELGVKI